MNVLSVQVLHMGVPVAVLLFAMVVPPLETATLVTVDVNKVCKIRHNLNHPSSFLILILVALSQVLWFYLKLVNYYFEVTFE